MLLRLDKILLFLLLIIGLPVVASGQITGKYVIGGFGNMGSTEMTYSSPAIFESARCLEVSNGLRIFLNYKQGIFSLTCPESQALELQVLAYPIPVTDYLNIKVLNSQNLTNNIPYYLHITDITGKIMQVVKTDLSALINGTRLSVGNLIQGNYIVSLLSPNAHLQSIKFIKNNR